MGEDPGDGISISEVEIGESKCGDGLQFENYR